MASEGKKLSAGAEYVSPSALQLFLANIALCHPEQALRSLRMTKPPGGPLPDGPVFNINGASDDLTREFVLTGTNGGRNSHPDDNQAALAGRLPTKNSDLAR
jgi:hypothetical protein